MFRQRHVQQPERRGGGVVLNDRRGDREIFLHALAPGNPRNGHVGGVRRAVRAAGDSVLVLEIMRAVVGGQDDDGAGQPGLGDGVFDDGQRLIAIRQRLFLFRRMRAVFVSLGVGIAEMDEAQVGLQGFHLRGKGPGHGQRAVLRLRPDEGVHAAGQIEMLELFLAHEHRRFQAARFGEAENRRHLHHALGRLVIVPKNLVRLRPHAGEHRGVRGQGEAGHDGEGIPRMRAFRGHLVKHRHVALLDQVRVPLVKTDDENMVGAAGIGGGQVETEAQQQQSENGALQGAGQPMEIHGCFESVQGGFHRKNSSGIESQSAAR